MISKDSIITYAQYNEDIVLAALLYETKKGFYVDVGANHETYHSVTKYFYKRGWTGINIEPIARLIEEFNKKRKKDINLQIGLSNKKGQLQFREYPEHDGLSTLSSTTKEDNALNVLPHKDYIVKVSTLSSVFGEHAKDRRVDFLKIDVEGYEKEVLEGNDWKKYRPSVICIEANHGQEDWSYILTDADYRKFLFDGLNEYYIAKEKWRITEGFAERAAILNHNALRDHYVKLWKRDLKYIKSLEAMTQRQEDLLATRQQQIEKLTVEINEARQLRTIGKSIVKGIKDRASN